MNNTERIRRSLARLQELIKMDAPDIIIENEFRILYSCLDELDTVKDVAE